MHKRSFKRLSQEQQPWIRVINRPGLSDDEFDLTIKKTTRWTSGNRRDQETRVLSAWNNAEIKKYMLRIFFYDRTRFLSKKSRRDASLALSKRTLSIQSKLGVLNKMHAQSRSKNTCLFSGKGSTFNRSLFVSRQTLRHLTRFGLISGLISGKRG